MGVYKSGTMPVIRKQSLSQLVMAMDPLPPRQMKKTLMRRFGIPFKATWHLTINETTGEHKHEFHWYEVETNV